MPGDAVEAVDTLTERRAEVQQRQDVEGTHHARWVVTADTPKVLAERVAALQQRYDGIVQLQQVSHIQDLLWKELLPGDQVRVPEFGHDQPLRTLAGSWFHGGSPFGDPEGPYMGANLGSSADPDPAAHRVPHRIRPDHAHHPGVHRAVRRREVHRAWSSPWPGSSQRARGRCSSTTRATWPGWSRWPAQVLGVDVQEIDVLDKMCAGTMDPMRFAPGADEARTLTLDAMLGALSADDRRLGETVLEAAIDRVLNRPRRTWSSPAVIAELHASRTRLRRHGGAHRSPPPSMCGRKPRNYARSWANSRQSETADDRPRTGVPALGWAGSPRHTPDPAQWSVAQRGSMATMRIAFSYALLQSRRARAMVKVVALTELHLLASNTLCLTCFDFIVFAVERQPKRQRRRHHADLDCADAGIREPGASARRGDHDGERRVFARRAAVSIAGRRPALRNLSRFFHHRHCRRADLPRTAPAQRKGSSGQRLLSASRARGARRPRCHRDESLAPEPNDRYGSAEHLAEDLTRYLRGLPVHARSSTAPYRLTKFVQRHMAASISTSLLAIAMLTGMVATGWQTHIARVERARAERHLSEVRELTNTYLRDVYDAAANLPGATAVRKLLVENSLKHISALESEANDSIEFQRDLAWAYQKFGDVQGDYLGANLGDTQGAVESYRRALRLRQKIAAGVTIEKTKGNSCRATSHSVSYCPRKARSPSRSNMPSPRFASANNSLRCRTRSMLIVASWRSLTRRSAVLLGPVDTQPSVGRIGKRTRALRAPRPIQTSRPAARRDLALVFGRTGQVLMQEARKPREALPYYLRASDIAESLLRENPLSAEIQRASSFVHSTLAEIYNELHEPETALDSRPHGTGTIGSITPGGSGQRASTAGSRVCVESTGRELFAHRRSG